MRSYLPMAVVAALVVVAVAAAFFLTPALAPPQVKLQEQIADKIAQAQAMLAAYSPSDAALLHDFDSAITSQPATASQPASDLDSQIRTALQTRQNVIVDALKIIKEAVATRVGAGDASITGGSSVPATRLEATLLIEQAQLLRRQAAFHWRRAALARDQLRGVLDRWTQLNTQIQSQQATLSGQGVLPEKPIESAPPVPAESRPQAAAPGAAAEHSRVGQLLSRLLGGPCAPSAAAAPGSQPAAVAQEKPMPEAAPAQTQPAGEIVRAAPTTRPARTPPSPDCTLAMSFDQYRARETESPQQRIADLQLCRQQVEQQLANSQKSQEALAAEVQQFHQLLDTAKAQANAAQKKMMALEQAGVDATDPNSLPRFTKEHNDASATYRRALRVISILTSGTAKEPQLKPEEKEMLSGPPIAIEQELPQDSRGVTALESDLAVAKGLVETRKNLLTQIDAQIARLTKSQQELEAYVAKLEADRKQQGETLAAAARKVIAEVVQAYQLEAQALGILQNQAPAAARRAEQAASKVISQAQAESSTHPENPRLAQQMGEASKFVAGDAKTLAADVDAAVAIVLAQRMGGLERHAVMLEQIEPASIPAASLLPEAAGQPAPGPWATSAAAAKAEADTSRADAIKAAIAASDGYADPKVKSDMKDLWTLEAQIAAMQYLLATLSSTPEEAAKHLKQAKTAYVLATRDRPDRPEVHPLRLIYDNLVQAK